MSATHRAFFALLALAAALSGAPRLAVPIAHAAAPGVIAATVSQAPAAAPTQPPPPPDAKTIRATIDADLAVHLDKLQAFENAYRVKAGKSGYYQTLISASTVPADGAAVAPDKLATGPTDQPEKLTDFWADAKLPAQLPYAFMTDVYDGPDGQGYVLTVQVRIGAELWQQSVNTGPERWRDDPWHVVVVADK